MNLIAKLLLNSLYGRFGMSPLLEKVVITDSVKDFILNNPKLTFLDHLDFGGNNSILSFKDEDDKSVKNSIGIASAVTSFARIEMSKYKNNEDFNLYYSDTDSIFIDKPLPDDLIGNDLGKMKLEYVINKAVFLGTKMYSLITSDLANGNTCKIKGYTEEVPFTVMKSLLIKDSNIQLHHTKWFRSLTDQEIIMKDQLYTLQKKV